MNNISRKLLEVIVGNDRTGYHKVISYIAPAHIGYRILNTYFRANIETNYRVTPVSFSIQLLGTQIEINI